MDVERLVEQARQGDLEAFAELTRRFQHMAFGYALSMVSRFFVAEPYTRRPGVFVSRAEALRVCREILDGVHDGLPEEAFYFAGGIEEIRSRVTP